MARMKFSLGNSTQSVLAQEDAMIQAANNRKIDPSAGPSARSVWTAFLTGQYSPELVQWYVNRYQDQIRPVGSGFENKIIAGSSYPATRPQNLTAGNYSPDRFGYESPAYSPYFNAYANGTPYPLANFDRFYTPSNRPVGPVENSAGYSVRNNRYYTGNNNLVENGPMLSGINISRPTETVPLSERSEYRSSLAALFKKKDNPQPLQNPPLLVMQHRQLQRMEAAEQQGGQNADLLEQLEYQRQIAGYQNDFRPADQNRQAEYNVSRQNIESFDPYDRQQELAYRQQKLADRQQWLAREQQWLTEQQNMLAQEQGAAGNGPQNRLNEPDTIENQEPLYSANDDLPNLPSSGQFREIYTDLPEDQNNPIQQVSGLVPYYQMPQNQVPQYQEPRNQNSEGQVPQSQNKNSGNRVYYPKGDFVP